jgi:CheY-like chemotaxis protein
MGGHILADSEVGKGTTFTLVMPAKLGDRNSNDSSAIEINLKSTLELNYDPEDFSKSKLREPKDLKILLAEDNLINQIVALRILGRMGYEADIANDGLEVLEILKSKHYDLILMDIQMPKMDGLETARQIQKQFKPNVRPAIIALSANAMVEDYQSCLEAGMIDHISKPINPQEFRRALEQIKI